MLQKSTVTLLEALDFSCLVQRPVGRLQGHRQVTDAYLVCLTVQNDGVLATLDKRIITAVKDTEYEESVISVWA